MCLKHLGLVSDFSFRLLQSLLLRFWRQKHYRLRHTTPEFDVPTKVDAKSSNPLSFQATSYKLFRAELAAKNAARLRFALNSKPNRAFPTYWQTTDPTKAVRRRFCSVRNAAKRLRNRQFFRANPILQTFQQPFHAPRIGLNLQNPRPRLNSSSRRCSLRWAVRDRAANQFRNRSDRARAWF